MSRRFSRCRAAFVSGAVIFKSKPSDADDRCTTTTAASIPMPSSPSPSQPSAPQLPPPIPWTTRLTVSAQPPPPSLIGDKILLPQSALEQLLSAAALLPSPPPPPPPLRYRDGDDNDDDEGEDDDDDDDDRDDGPWAKPAPLPARALTTHPPDNPLPHPLVVKLTNRRTGATAYAVPREFSADEGLVVMSPFLRKLLLGEKQQQHTPTNTAAMDVEMEVEAEIEVGVEAASLPKGTRVRLRPLEAGYDDEDWKAILERHLREGFATVVEGMLLQVPRGRAGNWEFLVDQALPGGAVCVVDTGWSPFSARLFWLIRGTAMQIWRWILNHWMKNRPAKP